MDTDKDRLAKLISDIKKYSEELESYKIKTEDDLKDSKTLFAASMVCFQTLNTVFDLCDL